MAGSQGSRIPDDRFVMIIGSMKSGTSTLFDLLASHPAVCASTPKELEFFATAQKHRLDARDYRDFWPDWDPDAHQWALEGSTGYTKWPVESGVAERIRAAGLRPRLIYVVRDPVARIVSHVNYMRIKSARHIGFEDSYPIDVSRYATQLDPYVAAFGRDAIRVVDFGQLTTDPAGTCGALVDWLGLAPHPIATATAANETSALRTSRLHRIVYGSRILRRAAKVVPPRARLALGRAAVRAMPHRARREALTPVREAQIRAELAPDMARLQREWGIDVGPWGFAGG